MQALARNVTKPRSPGPAPTKKTLPLLAFLLVLLLLFSMALYQFGQRVLDLQTLWATPDLFTTLRDEVY